MEQRSWQCHPMVIGTNSNANGNPQFGVQWRTLYLVQTVQLQYNMDRKRSLPRNSLIVLQHSCEFSWQRWCSHVIFLARKAVFSLGWNVLGATAKPVYVDRSPCLWSLIGQNRAALIGHSSNWMRKAWVLW